MAYTAEDWEQIAFVDYCELRHWRIFAIPNGGSRHKLEAKKLVRTGTRKGVPDLFIPYARRGFHGLFVEMKAEGGRASKEQREWVAFLNEQGYKAEVCVGFDEARKLLDWYMGGE